MKQNDWATKENQIQDDFVWRIGPEALYQMTRAEYKTEPDEIAIKDFIRLFNPTKKDTYHNRGDIFWTTQTEAEKPEDFWRRLIEIKKEGNKKETLIQSIERKETRNEEKDRNYYTEYIQKEN